MVQNMNDFAKTVLVVAVAAALAGAAYLTRPVPIADARFSDQGELFFPDFKDPTLARSLQVLAYDEAGARIRPFRVEFDGSRWVIPSHHGYPADASKNMAEAAAVFIGLRKEQVVTDLSAEHEALGVLAPDEPAAPLKGRGTRVTLTGEGGAPLADLIIGKTVVTSAPDPTGMSMNRRYVRVPGKNRVYAVDFTKTFSTGFADWVETDLLRLGSERVDRLVVDRYEVDEKQGVKRSIEKITMERNAGSPADPANPFAPPPASGWSVVAEPGGPPAEGESVNAAKVEEVIGTLRSMKIAGVRPKPQKLADWFAGRTDRVTQMDVLDLQTKGFFTTQQGQFVGNEGEMQVACADGVVYTLYFGEVLYGEGAALSAGDDVIGSAGGSGDASGPPEERKGQESRYAFVSVRFDESLIPHPTPPALESPAEKQPPSEPDQEHESPSDDPTPSPGGAEQDSSPTEQPASAQPAEAAKDPAWIEYERKVEERRAKVEAGRSRAEALSKRFADWYYVIDAASFNQLRPARSDVITTQGAPARGTADAPMMPPIGPQ